MRFLHLLLVVDDPADALKRVPGIGSKELLQSSICAKLGVKSLLQAISVSSANRWFDELPYEMQEVSRVMSELPDLNSHDRWRRDEDADLEPARAPELSRSSGF